MNKKQGLEDLVEAIHQLADLPNIVWLLAGEGPTSQLVKATQGLTHVYYYPLQPMERLNDWLNVATFTCYPRKRSCHLVPFKLRIPASGKPVVASSPRGSEFAVIAEQAGAVLRRCKFLRERSAKAGFISRRSC